MPDDCAGSGGDGAWGGARSGRLAGQPGHRGGERVGAGHGAGTVLAASLCDDCDGRVVGGATIERPVEAKVVSPGGELAFLLAQPNFETAQSISDAINRRYGAGVARVENADRVVIKVPSDAGAVPAFAAGIENLQVAPARSYRVVVNERTGTIVAGGDVMISPVTISQGDLRISVETRNEGSQPYFTSSLASDVSSLTISNTRLDVESGKNDAVVRMGSTTVGDLVQALNGMNVDTRRIISILQALKSAGALHAELVVE